MGFVNFATAVERHVLAVATRRDLSRLSDATLADIGLRREAIAEAATAMANVRLSPPSGRPRFAFWDYFRGLARV